MVIRARVPLSEMFGYVNDLRGFTQGRASFTMTPSHYEEVPRNVAEEIAAKVQGKTKPGSNELPNTRESSLMTGLL